MAGNHIEKAALAAMLDHSNLKPDLDRASLEAECGVARKHGAGYICVKPCHVVEARCLLSGSGTKVITVVGFPLGYSKPEVKVLEAEQALSDGAEELDMVINVTALKSGEDKGVLEDIRAITAVAAGVPVKVIIEACYLTNEEKVKASRLIVDGGAQFVKTSTGFGSGGATVEDIRLIRRTVGPAFGVKAAGGVRTFEAAVAMIAAGANRLGVTATEAIMRGWEESGGRY